jgi:hyperosmotically inducible periplasmic protein
MKVRLFAALAALLLVAGVCLAADKPITDDSISDYVRLRLASDADVKGGALIVDVKNGVVTIGGTVESARQKDKATKLAKKVKGVKQVVNNITLKEKIGGK